MRTIDQRAVSKMTSGEFSAWLLFRMDLEGAAFTFTDCDIPLHHSGELYLPGSFEIEPVRYSSSTVVDLLNVRVSDIEEQLKSSFVGGTPNGSSVALKLYVDIDDTPGLVDDETGATFGPTVHGLCLADGSAFLRVQGVDLSQYAGVAGVSTPYKIILKDSAGKKAVGYIADADAAEALEASVIASTNPGFETLTSGTDDDGTSDNFANWTETNDDANGAKTLSMTDSVHAGGSTRAVKITRGTSAASMSKTITNFLTPGKLYKMGVWNHGDGTTSARLRVTNTWAALLTTGVTSAADYSLTNYYFTAAASGTAMALVLYSSTTLNSWAYFDDISIQEVTHSGADGVHIVSSAGGATRNWASIEAGFNYNATSYSFNIVPAKQSDDAAITIFRGEIDGWNVDEGDLQIYVANDMSNWNQRPLNKHGASCRWKKFKGANPASPCMYSGEQTWCDRSYSRCLALVNADNFGGYRWLPSLETKELFWGHTFGES